MATFRLYHGSRRKFEAFSKDVHPRFDNAQQHIGYFFTNDPAYAVKYADFPEGQLYVVDCEVGNVMHEPLRGAVSLANIIERNYSNDDAIEYADGLIEAGYNSICFEIPGDDDAVEIALFYPEQAVIAEVIHVDIARRMINDGDLSATELAIYHSGPTT